MILRESQIHTQLDILVPDG